MWNILLLLFLLIVISIVLILIIGTISFNMRVKKEVKSLIKDISDAESEIISADDIKHLPEPVQRYLNYAQVPGKKKIKFARLKQEGSIRTSVDQKWIPFKAKEYYSAKPPSFIWTVTIKSIVRGRDIYSNGKGNMLIKLFSLFPIVDAKSKEIDQGSFIRYFNELVFFPTAFLDENITWEELDENSCIGTMTDHDLTVSAVFYFSESGEITHFVCHDRYRTVGKHYIKEKWTTPFRNYKEMNGFKVPTEGEAIWNLSSGDFTYIKLRITDIDYDSFSIY